MMGKVHCHSRRHLKTLESTSKSFQNITTSLLIFLDVFETFHLLF